MNILAERAFKGLEVEDGRIHRVKYSGHFKGYNANAKYNKEKVDFNLSFEWRKIDDDIQIGLIQSLIVKILKIKKNKTTQMELYETFMKSLSKYAKKHTHEPELEESFNRVNEKMFNGLMDKPNLVFASESFNKLGSYEYSTDTIHISTIFQDLPDEELRILDYVLYHELLHKKHSFNIKNGRHRAHTREFRNDERKFGETAEQELTNWLRKKKLRKWKFW
ncbi:MAG: hypothetical protein ACP5NV_02270 [Candidatus Woesearchaeota archaeon]